MKTTGQILHQSRLALGISLDRLSEITKIDVKYITALEADDYKSLPSETFAKGFIRNLSQNLGKNPDDLVAIFRRDYRQSTQVSKSPVIRRNRTPLSVNFFSSRFALITIGALVFSVYLFFQFRFFLAPPKLQLIKPAMNSVLVSPVDIEGTTSTDTGVTINGDIQAKPDADGHFSTGVTFPVGENKIEIKATNRFGRSITQSVTITIVSQ